MKINAYLNFNGNCAEALKFYEKTLGAKVIFKLTYGETPACKETPKERTTRSFMPGLWSRITS